MTDFPPLVWFSRNIDPPKCLTSVELVFTDNITGEVKGRFDINKAVARGLSMTRVALGFSVSDIAVRPWRDHPGYATLEGRELNESAIDFGDDPNDWFVSDEPVDVMKISEFRSEVIKGSDRRMARQDWYLADIRRMVTLCRTTPGVHIPPSWVGEHNLADYAKLLREKPGQSIPLTQSSYERS